MKVVGEPVPVAADVAYSGAEKVAASVSKNGILLYVKGGNLRQTRMIWFDRTGHEIGPVGGLSAHVEPTISPDGTKIAFESNDATDDIWVLDLVRGTQTRVTTDPGDESEPVWSPDGRRILYGSNRVPPSLWVARSSGGGDEKVWEANVVFATDWSRDDEVLVNFLDSALKLEIAIFSMKDRRTQRIASSRFNEEYARFSPDAKWIVYRSDESGEFNIYVLSRATGERFLISTAGGQGGHWSRDGDEIYYVAPDGNLMAVPVKTVPAFEAGTPVVLFPIAGSFDTATRDRFLVNVPAGGDRIVPATLVQNWLATIRDGASAP
jgi:Tol biopolymer transport system component